MTTDDRLPTTCIGQEAARTHEKRYLQNGLLEGKGNQLSKLVCFMVVPYSRRIFVPGVEGK